MKLYRKIFLGKSGLIFSILAAFLFLPQIVRADIDLIINEIMYDLPGSDSKHEWIELYNAGSSEINLDDWRFNDGDNHLLKVSRGSLILAPGEFLILSGDATTTTIDLTEYQGTIIDTVMSLNNTAATLKILNQDGAEIAVTSYVNSAGAAGNGKTLEWDGSTFRESYSKGGTPGAPNSVLSSPPPTPSPTPSPSPAPSPTPESTPENTATPEPSPSTIATPTPSFIPSASPSPAPSISPQYSKNIFINEFMPYPPQGQSEWVELYNSGNETINLNGWQIDDSNSNSRPHVISQDTQIGPLGLIVINLSKALLNNDDDEVRLLWPDDQILHNIVYDSAKQGYSVARLSDGRWVWTDQPSPGQKNPAIAVETKNSKMPSPSPSPTSAPNFLAAQISLPSDSPLPVISTLQEQVVSLADVSQKNSSQNTNRQTAAPTNNALSTENSVGGPQANEGQLTNNLTAAAQNEIKNSNTSALVWLAAVLILSAAAALGLLYFKRRQVPTVAVDKKKTKF